MDCFCRIAFRGAPGSKNERLYGKMLWKGRRNVDGGTGESGTAVDTMGAEVMDTVDSWEKVSQSERGRKKQQSYGEGHPTNTPQ